MSRRSFRQVALAVFVLILSASLGRSDDDSSQSQEEQRELAAIERFKKVLEANPRRGVALDRLYGFHVERGTLDQLVSQYQKRAADDANDGAALMVVGLLEAQRGRDAAAADAFRSAEKRLSSSALPAYYLGQSLVLIGQPDAAAEAFERAIARKPSRTDLLEIFQALGRVYQRAQRSEKALSVWTRLEELFPDDPRVEEEIASTLVEEGQAEQALPRIEKLAKQVPDPYRRTTLLVEAAELKVRLKRTADALADLEALIGELSTESWLYRDVRRRIEDVFLRNDDLAGLTKYYEQWLAKNPHDLEAIARLARTLSSQGRGAEASKWLRQGLDVAPTNKGLRQALIDQLAYERQFAAAGKEYEALDHGDPNNPDVLREWGKLLLRDSSRPEADRKQAALSIWKRLLDNKPKDAVTAAQVADLVRSAGLTDEAITLYKKAVELAPASAQYREYLGEYLHSLKRSDEALGAWRPIAEGANRTAKNLARLSEVLAGFGYRKQAIEALAESLKLEKDDFNRLLTFADLLHEDGRHDDALAQLDTAAKLASNAEESESVLQAQLKIYQATDTLASRTEELQKQLDSGADATAERWHRLARYYDAARQPAEATASILKALEKDPKSIAILTSAARIHESGGNLLAAADTFRKLAAIDRRFRTEHLTAVAKLEQRLGRREQAMQAGRDLLAAAPGNPEHHKFFAELCFQLGDPEEGLESLRRSVRANPSDPEGLLTLGQALANRQRPGEAIELFWRALDKTDDLDGKLSVIGRLAELYLTSNQFDRLLERLDHQRREADKNREMTLCIAQAYQRAGDISAARQELERLLTEQSRDTALLFQLSQLAEAESDLAAAVKFQRRVLAVTPTNHDAQLRLAQLLVRSGESDEAAEIWVKLVAGEPEPHRNLQAIDQLIANRKFDTVLAITARLLAQKPGDWELLYREGTSLAALDRTAEATTRFQAVLALKISDDTEGAAAKFERKKKPTAASTMASASAGATTATFAALGRAGSEFDAPLARRINEISFLRAFTGLEPRLNYAYSQSFRGWAPRDFGQARMASLGWLLGFSTAQNSQAAFLNSYRPPKDKGTADPRRIWDWYYVQLVRQDSREAFEASRLLAAFNDPAGQYAYLSSLSNRGRSSSRYYRPGTNADHTPPLPADQIELMLAAYRKLQLHNPDWLSSAVVDNVQSELRRAKRPDDEESAYRQIVSTANTLQSVQQALSVAGQRGDVAGVTALFEKLAKLQGPSKISIGQPSIRTAYPAIGQAMAVRVQQKGYQDAIALFDLYLTAIRKQNLAAPKTFTASRSNSRSATMGQIPIYSAQPGGRGTRYIYVSGEGPQINDYLDQGALVLLRNAFELFKKADLLSDLFGHFDKQLEVSPPAQRVYLHLTLGALDWWNDDREEALKQLTLATQQVPDDSSLVLDVAELREKNNEFDAALALLDSVSPLDQNIMQRRELAAIRLAERTGNVARARTAAERLFGLRLDASTQIDLAGQMHRLGMHEMAEMVLNRAQRQSGNRADALVSLMNQYQSLNQTDLALQIARQILRRAPSGAGMSQSYRSRTPDDGNRDQAISVIARSGQLKEMIERAEAQLKSSPKSPQILQTLLDYYKAAGDKSKYKAAAQRLVEAKPDEPRLRYQISQQLQSMGDKAAAIEHLKQAIRLDPSVYSNDYWEINRLFQEQKKSDELVKVFEEIDLRKSGGNYFAYTEIVQSLLQNEATQQQGLSLLKKVWEAFPNERNYIMGNFYRDQVFQLPEMFEFAKSGLLPTDDGPSEPWRGTEELSSYNGDGRIDGIFSRTLNIARQQNRIGVLRREIDAAVKKHPEWRAGKAILAVIDLQTGHPDHVRDVFGELIDDKDYPIPAITGFTLAQELDHYGGLEDLRLKLLEASVDDYLTDKNTSDEFSYSPVRQLVNYYEQADRKEDARRLIQRCLGFGQYDSDPGYGAYRRIQSAGSVAEEMLKIGEPIEAARIYNDVLSDDEALAFAANFGGSNNRQWIESNLHRAIAGLRRDNLPTAMQRLLTPRNLAGPGGAAVDLVLLVEPRDYQKATLVSMFEATLRMSNDVPALRTDAQDKLAKLAAAHPNDLSVATAEALAALAAADPSAAQKAVVRLIKLTEQAPLESLASGARPNSRQRAEAFDQIGLWLVGRACLKQPALHDAGEQLSARSVAAARRQLDRTYAVAVLREWAQIDLEHGEKQSAEARFREIIDVLLPQASGQGSHGKPAPAAVVTTDQFRQSIEFARLAAENGLVDISRQTAGEALAGGPPAAPVSKNGPSRIVFSTPVANTNDSTSVEQSLANLIQRWRQAGAKPDEIYDTLAAVVLPKARPDEVFLYSHVDYGMAGDRSVGRLLINAAIRAGKVDDLRSRITPRAGKALGELPGKVLLAELAIESGDTSQGLELLAELAKRLQKDTLQTTAEIVGGVAISAIKHKELAGAATPIIEQAAKNLAISNRIDEVQALLLRVVRFQLEARDEQAARKALSQISETTQRLASRNNEYFVAQQSEQLAREYAKAGWAAESLAELGKHVDIASTNQQFGPGEPTTSALVPAARRLLELPAGQRYELLRTWTLPTQGRRSIRMAFAEAPRFSPPADFGRITRPGGPSVSTVGLLIEAAQQCGKLDELAADLEPLAKDKVENADTLRLIVALACGHAGESETELSQRLSEIVARAKPTPQLLGQVYYDNGNRPSSVRWSDIHIARTAAASQRTTPIAERILKTLFEQARQRNDQGAIAQVDAELFAINARRIGTGASDLALSCGLEHWSNERLGSVWVSADGHIQQALARAWPVWSSLMFDSPLGGTFEFSIDAYRSPEQDGPLGFAGLVYAPLGGGSIAPLGEHEIVNRPVQKFFDNDFNRITIQASPEKVRCLINGQLFYEDSEPRLTCPWLMLLGPAGRKPTFRNPVLTGQPEVLREVRLSAGDDLRGWTWHVYSAQLPARLAAREPQGDRSNAGYSPYDDSQIREPAAYDWQAKDGEILGKGLGQQVGNPVPSALCYVRPLHSGDKLRYEFFYRSGEFHVHPCVGRLAFLLEAEGVRLHWLTPPGNEEWTGLASDNAVAVPADRRGPEKLPLKSDDWNSLQIVMNGDTLTLHLNDQVIYERKLGPDEERGFSLFHYQDKSAVRVRNVVLEGNWPRRLQSLDVVSIESNAGPAERRARRSLIGESMFAKSAGLLLARVHDLPATERFQQLADWVLPNASHGVFQLAGEFVPAAEGAGGAAAINGPRVLRGNQLESPVLELVKAAREIGKLDDLAERVTKVELPQGRDLDERCRQAILAMIRIAQARDAEAEPKLRSLADSAAKRPLDAEAAERWPEYLAAITAAERPATRAAAVAILDAEVRGLDASFKEERPFADRDAWSRMVRNARARLVVRDLPMSAAPGFGSGPRFVYWIPVSWASAFDRGSTRGLAHWEFRDGVVHHYPGYQQDDLYFRLPLVGDFEVSCELTSSDWGRARIQYGGVRCDLGDSPKSFELQMAGRPARKTPLNPPLNHLGDWTTYRMVVKDGACAVSIGDRQILSETLPVDFDPWLMIDVPHDDIGGVRSFKLTGNPSIPERIDLSGGFTLGAWRSNYTDNPWQKLGEEIYSQGEKPTPIEGRPAPPRFAPERALHYHRPLLEDGEIEYEFYYRPGKSLVHPALDQIAFLLAPEGIRIHRLTTPADARSGLSIDNAIDEPANRRGPAKLPLKEHAWNRAVLAVAGDTVTITINGEKVFERSIEPTNQRTFGLFHYADETEARVRKVNYRGNWPKQFPKTADWFATESSAAAK